MDLQEAYGQIEEIFEEGRKARIRSYVLEDLLKNLRSTYKHDSIGWLGDPEIVDRGIENISVQDFADALRVWIGTYLVEEGVSYD